ncbi:MAG TPA: glycosyl hydrolase family 28-related protein, partial [Polyangiaceae bacterium]
TPDDGTDDSAAIRKAIADARTQNKVLFIPKGTFDQTAYDPNEQSTPKLAVSGITIRGAGMWYSVLKGFGAQFEVSGNDNQFYDFAVFGDVTYRDDTKGWQGFDGPAGTGSRMENVWIEHETAGWWVGKGAFVGQVTQALTTGLVVHGVRIRDTYADGVNFNDATKDSIVEQSSFRNTGDDSLATWSYTADGPAPCDGNVFRFNTVQAVWRANCLAIYGGSNNSMQDNTCADTSNYPGILLSTTFSAIAFGGTTTVQRNTLTRAGGPHYGQQFGALRIFADTAPVSGIQVNDVDVVSPTFSGIHFGGAQQTSGVTMSGVQVSDYGTVGIWVSSEAHGSAEMDDVTVTGSLNKGLQNDAPNAFTLNRGSGDTGW